MAIAPRPQLGWRLSIWARRLPRWEVLRLFTKPASCLPSCLSQFEEAVGHWQGEAVHSLQRAIHNGMITAKQGRTTEELGAISGALTLLANIVMAWNTHHIQAMLDLAPDNHPDEVMSRLAPIGHKHINMRGILTFDLARHRSNLLRQAPSAAADRALS